MDNNEDIKKWCMYCKNPIRKGQPHVTQDEDFYHMDCFKQMNCFYDPFADDEDYE